MMDPLILETLLCSPELSYPVQATLKRSHQVLAINPNLIKSETYATPPAPVPPDQPNVDMISHTTGYPEKDAKALWRALGDV